MLVDLDPKEIRYLANQTDHRLARLRAGLHEAIDQAEPLTDAAEMRLTVGIIAKLENALRPGRQ
jgi:hypothetical protein